MPGQGSVDTCLDSHPAMSSPQLPPLLPPPPLVQEHDWPASLDDLAEAVVARYGRQLWLHYEEMEQWLNNFNVRQVRGSCEGRSLGAGQVLRIRLEGSACALAWEERMAWRACLGG